MTRAQAIQALLDAEAQLQMAEAAMKAAIANITAALPAEAGMSLPAPK